MQRKNKLGKALAVVFALLLWQIAAAAVDQSILLVSPVDVAVRMTSIWQVDGFASSIWFSFYHIAGGFLLALAVVLLVSGGLLAWPSLWRGRGGLSAAEATQLINRRNAVVVDVRSAAEFAAGHLPAARHLPSDEMAPKIGQIAKNKST